MNQNRPSARAKYQQLLAIGREHYYHLRYFEYWPTRLFYLPVYAKVLYWAIRLRSFAFMTAVNPAMEFGGLLNYSKSRVLQALPPDKTLPALLVAKQANIAAVLAQLPERGLHFPLIAKPDLGERGFGVEVVHTAERLHSYLSEFRAYEVILQHYLHPAKEFAVLYCLSPAQAERGELGEIRSICAKQALTVQGDGHSCLWQLVATHERAAKRFSLLRQMWRSRWYDVLPAGEPLQLTHIGAHSMGTDCYSAMERNSPELLEQFARLSQALNPDHRHGRLGFCFGRYDILAKDWEAVLRGEFKVIELNGVNAEPLHIYQPGYSVWRGWRTLWRHWHKIGLLAREMQQRGQRPCTGRELLRAIKEHDRKIKCYSQRSR